MDTHHVDSKLLVFTFVSPIGEMVSASPALSIHWSLQSWMDWHSPLQVVFKNLECPKPFHKEKAVLKGSDDASTCLLQRCFWGDPQHTRPQAPWPPQRSEFTHLFIPVQPIPLNTLHLFMCASSMESHPLWFGPGWDTKSREHLEVVSGGRS